MAITLQAPAGVSVAHAPGARYAVGEDGTVAAAASDVLALLGMGFYPPSTPESATALADAVGLLAIVKLTGSAMLIQNAGAPDGTIGVDLCDPGALCIDTTGHDAYINVGTKHVPSWKKFTRAA